MCKVIWFKIDRDDDPSKTHDGRCWHSADQLKLCTTDGQQRRAGCGMERGLGLNGQWRGCKCHLLTAVICLFREGRAKEGCERRWGKQLKHTMV